MRRITIDEVRAACETTGYRLEQGVTLDDRRRCGCPAGILAKSTGVLRSPFSLASDLGVHHDYLDGMMNGFDDYDSSLNRTEQYTLGCADGSAIRAALLPA